MIALASFVAVPSALYMLQVFLKSFQQLSVTRNQIAAIVPVSIAMTISNNYIIAFISEYGRSWELDLVMGICGGLGSILAIKLHGRIFK